MFKIFNQSKLKMKRALLLFAMFAFLGTAYTATASVENTAGIYCDNCKGGHKCDDNCKKECKKAKKNKNCKTATKKGCCSKSSSTAKSCHGKSGTKASASATDKKATEKK